MACTLNTDAMQVAILQYRNTPDPTTKLSPAECIFGRPVKEFIPITPGRYKPHPTWQDTLRDRENALRHRHMQTAERLSEHTRRLPPLKVGDHVRVQNQIGRHPKKWDKTGLIIEVRQFDQYVIRIDGSGRLTTRNRKFLRKFTPVHDLPQSRTIDIDTEPPTKPHNVITTPATPCPKDTQLPPPPDTPLLPPLILPTPTRPNHDSPEAIPTLVSPKGQTPPDEQQETPHATPSVARQKAPLALRRLQDFNAKGLKE